MNDMAQTNFPSCKKVLSFVVLLMVFLTGCSMTSLTMKATKPLIRNAFLEVMDEPDLTIARTAIESDLKLLDGVLRERPNDRELLTMSAMGTFAYSYAYADDDSSQRAKLLYQRSMEYALRGLKTYGFEASTMNAPVEKIEQEIAKLPTQADPFLFWYSLSSAMNIMLSLDNPNRLADLPRIEAIMKLVRSRDSTYFYGGAPLFFGVLTGFRPKVLGGDPVQAEREFDQCRSISDNKFLLERVFRARYLWVSVLDETKFRTELQYVIDAPDDILPGNKLLTAIAKAKAKKYLSRAGDWF